MLRSLFCLIMVLGRLAAPLGNPEQRVVFAMKSGILLRMHVIAQDDTEEMQHLKLTVRDAVRQCYDERCPGLSLSMLETAKLLLPELSQTASDTAASEGYQGTVETSIETLTFDARELDGYLLPAGEYPALIIRLGEARGHNWWGLIDPDLALRAAALPDETDGETVQWDWSFAGFLRALLGLPLPGEGGGDA